jgi:HAD superfamily hydrolase (TIGR01490 family)
VLAQHPVEQLHRWRAAFVEQKIKPWLLPQGQTLIQQHQNAGAVVAIITATNFFVAEPIAQMMGVPHLIATRPRLEKGRYTGAFDGIPTFAHGKIQAFNHWLAGHQLMASETWFYSDSHNDLPLLQQVDHPIAVDPDPLLQQTAQQNSWPIISLRQ